MARFLPLAYTEAELRDEFDAGTVSRGAAYAKQGRVADVRWSGGGLRLLACCAGSDANVYDVEIEFDDVGDAERILVEAFCTCPVEIDCKHAVAVLLLASRQGVPAAGTTPSTPQWRALLGELVAAGDAAPTRRGTAPIGILVEAQGSRRDELTSPTLRLVSPSKTGSWVRTGLTWQSIRPNYREDYYRVTKDHPPEHFHPTHLARVRAIADAAHTVNPYPRGQVLDLDETPPEIWDLLVAAVDAGVVLLAHKSTGASSVALAAGCRASLRITRGDDGLTVGPWLQMDGYEWDGSPVGLFGEPNPHGFYNREGDTLYLGPFQAPASMDAFRELLSLGSITVPDDDAEDFSTDLLPGLSASMAVDVDDDALIAPEVSGPALTLTVRVDDSRRAVTTWTVGYEVNGRQRSFEVDKSAGVRDRQAEAEAWKQIRPQLESAARLCGSWRTQALPHIRQAHRLGEDVGLTADALDSTRDAAIARSESTLLARPYRYTAVETARLCVEVVPDLRDHGVQVEIVGDAPDYRPAQEFPRIDIAADGSRDNDWFGLAITVNIDGTEVPLTDVLRELSHGATHMLLPSGVYFPLDSPELARIAELVAEAKALGEIENGRVRGDTYNATLWEELLALGVVDRELTQWHERLKQLASAQPPQPCPPPAGLKAQLRDYQTAGLDWLYFLWHNRIGGILADDMGLGKTVQTLAVIATAIEEKPDGRFLVVAPTSVISNWAAEAERFVPGLAVATVTATSARAGAPLAEQIGDSQIVITSYALMRLDFDEIGAIEWTGVIFDEAQFVKNHNAKGHQCARRLTAEIKLAITGTPMENNLMELWSLLSLTAPGLFPSPKVFTEYFRKPIESGTEPDRLAVLRRRIRPVMLRRTKDQVASDLPAKQEQVLSVDLTAKHDKIYQTRLTRERQKVLGLLRDYDENRFEIFRSLTMLRQLSLHAGLVDDKHAKVDSAKIDFLAEQIPELIDEGHSALVFSQFTSFLTLIAQRLDEIGIGYSYLDGSMRSAQRATAVKKFTSGKTKVFLISLKAGGFGLNLTEADYCFVCDPWWNPATEAQAVDRAHRIGQTRPVTVYRLVSAGTIEEKVVALQDRKRELFSAVIDDGDLFGSAISAEDIRELLGGQ
ncbi:helicase [Gordonia sp. HNM0687]|uniref:Helicase n=1 Tax=Gordonia mangrovi TaxID=2665643 RepID=A0A6L7GMY0_9ACTN|nr:DEAD/DEAH box helicase [Gordonia mangrovi]MXP21289.1 helicase [Gordonia mangrovi]UVF80042.1 DEAD/DEAH box helicase [Gordonia mangrovi]